VKKDALASVSARGWLTIFSIAESQMWRLIGREGVRKKCPKEGEEETRNSLALLVAERFETSMNTVGSVCQL
jgi:hypothetical protein